VTISNLDLVDSSGKSISATATSAEREAAFPPMGVVNATKLRWESLGKSYELILVKDGKKSSWDVLPDRTGVVVTNKEEQGLSKLTVINADTSVRFELDNPWPTHPKFSKTDRYGFSYPTTENGQPGVVVWVWAESPSGSGVAVEHFYALDSNTGTFLNSHPTR
jgi:hypothetical protein